MSPKLDCVSTDPTRLLFTINALDIESILAFAMMNQSNVDAFDIG
jgi:hypothetical protein